VKKKIYIPPLLRWCVQGLAFYRLRHLIFALTAAMCAAILCAAILTGDSLHAGLERDLRLRLGAVRSGIMLDRGLFPVDLARRIPQSETALMLRGAMLSPEGVICADQVNIFGVMGESENSSSIGVAALNQRAAEIVQTFNNAGWSYRFSKPSPFAVELPLGTAGNDDTVRSYVDKVQPVEESLISADFDPSPASVLPVNIRVPYRKLAAAAGAVERANLLLSTMPPQELQQSLQENLTAADIGLQTEVLSDNNLEIKCDSVFLPSTFSDRLRESVSNCLWTVVHLADDFCAVDSELTTPYGFVAGISPDGKIIKDDMRADQIVVNSWLAEKLAVEIGNHIELKWRRFNSDGTLTPMEKKFEISDIISMEDAGKLKERMPALPGLEGVDSCAEWDIGMPMDEKKLNDQANEEYWRQLRETPKAVITHAAALKCFGTVFGDAMSVRAPVDPMELNKIVRAINPASFGLQVRPLWEEGLAAAQGSTDFRALFIGISFLLMFSALLLCGLTLALLLERRVFEPALLAALGLSSRRAFTLILGEWIMPIIAGTLAGGFGGSLLARALIWSLGRFWRDAFDGADITFYFSLRAVILAAIVTALLLMMILFIKIGRFCRVAPIEFLRHKIPLQTDEGSSRGALLRLIGGPVCTVVAILIIINFNDAEQANGAFFGAGFLLMISLALFASELAALWRRSFHNVNHAVLSPCSAGVMSACSSGKRGRILVILLALGFFLTIGMLAMKHDPTAGSEHSSSGSGGFQSIVYATSPKTLDNGLTIAARVSGAKNIVPVRVKEGDEASCLNMSMPQTPRLYGVPIEQMAELRAFEPENAGGIWSVLRDELEEGVIPVLASDQAMLQYSLKMRADPVVGDEISYRGADGREWRLRIAGVLPVRVSILQGALLMNEKHFVRMFPGEGYRMWLCDYAPYLLRERNAPTDQYPEAGIRIESAVQRLQVLGKIESVYLDMFLVLGGLGLLLGVMGVILVIARSIEERRYEFTVLQALGISRRHIVQALVTEYGLLATFGMLIGLIPALIAVQPAASALNSTLNWLLVSTVTGVLVAAAFAAVVCGSFFALRRFDFTILTRE